MNTGGAAFCLTVAFCRIKSRDQFHSVLLSLEKMGHHLALRSDTTPSSRQAGFAEQCRFDRHGVEPGDVPGWIRPLDVELIGLRDPIKCDTL